MLTQQKLFDAILQQKSQTPIDVAKLFPEYLQDGKLVIENMAFCALGYELKNLDFSNCLLKNCDFSHTVLLNCTIPAEQCDRVKFGTPFLIDIPVKNPQYQLHALLIEYARDRGECQKWLNYLWNIYPDVFYNYHTVSRFATEGWLSPSDNFIVLKPFNEANDSSYLGWKCHVNVDTSMAQSNDWVSSQLLSIVGPILAKYHLPFKISCPAGHIKEQGHTWDDAQMTIYLESNHTTISDVNQLTLVMEEISAALGPVFKPGTSPKSDAQTFSPYCSIRNDYDSWDERLFSESRIIREIGYIDANLVKQANPLCVDNPFIDLLKSKSDLPFDLTQHFSSFEPFKNSIEAFYALQLTVCAYLKQNTLLDNLDQEHMSEQFRSIVENQMIPEDLLKDNATAEKNALLFSALLYIYIAGHPSGAKGAIPDRELQSLYRGDNDVFSAFLAYVDKAIRKLPVVEETGIFSIEPPPSFEDFIHINNPKQSSSLSGP